jgi:chromosome segregation protein
MRVWYTLGQRLNKLVLQGFKSFADRTVFEFTKNFTAVVGPNGSGKSNISDAIRWVLGEQSVKTLRGKESTDLIFGGSESLSKLGMAQVELYLDNSDHTVPIEFEEIVISRKIFRDGESEYRMNGAKVRLQDIVMMLAKARFGQKSYAVIGQGMITQFLNSTPQDRKIFFDEATGVREFQIKRDQAINKLIRTEEHLVQCETLITEIDPHLKSLTRQVKRLEKRAEVEQQLSAIQLDYFGSLWRSRIPGVWPAR